MSAEQLKIKGNALFKQRKYPEALALFSEAIELDPNNAIYFCNRAACYCAQGVNKYFCEAIADCDQAIKLDPHYAKAYGRLAWICYQNTGISKAIINYQKAINCLNKQNKSPYAASTTSAMKQYKHKLRECQSMIKIDSGSIMSFQSNLAKQLFVPDLMKQKYRNYLTMTALGIPEEQIPAYSGDEAKGEKSLTLKEILNEISLIFRMLSENPEAVVKVIGKSLNPNTDHTKNSRNKIDDENQKSNVVIDHSFKYEKIAELENSKKEIEGLFAEINQNDLEQRGIWGLMIWKYERAINKYKHGIKNNEPNENFETWDDCDLNEDDDIYGYPDCMAKTLLFEHEMLPWDDGVDAKLAKMYNW